MKQDRRIRKSKEAMQKALMELLHTKQYNQISICELCEIADINRSTFYSNYSHIDELLKEIHFALFDAMVSYADIYPYDAKDITQRKQIIAGMLKYIQIHQNQVDVLFHHDEHHLLVRNMLQFFSQRYGYVSSNTQIYYPLIYHTVAFFTMLNQWVRDHYPISADDLAQMIITHSRPLYKTNDFISQHEKNHV